MKRIILIPVIILVFMLILVFKPTNEDKAYYKDYNNMPQLITLANKRLTAQELQDSIKAQTEAKEAKGSTNADTSTVDKVIEFCRSKEGDPYLFGGRGDIFNDANINKILSWSGGMHPDQIDGQSYTAYFGKESYDCSGLMYKAFQSVGIDIGTSTYDQINVGEEVGSMAEAKPGDLIFPHAGHVMLYIGNGKVIHAPHTGTVVKEVDNPYPDFIAIRRIIKN